MRYKTLAIIAGFLAATSAAHAQQMTEIGKAAWIEHMRGNLPAAFCAEGSAIRGCFKVSQQRCSEVAASATATCLKKFEGSLPQTIHLPDEGRKWGTDIGQCAGEAFEQMLLSEKVNKPECN